MAALFAFGDCLGADGGSAIGYLTVGEAGATLEPDVEKIFVIPQSEAAVYGETPAGSSLLIEFPDGAVLCLLPRTRKNLTATAPVADRPGWVYFRSGMELDSAPLELPPGLEMEIISRTGDAFSVSMPLAKGGAVKITIPANMAGLSFSKTGAAAEFADRQLAKGLALFEGEWLPVKEAGRREKVARDAAEKRKYAVSAAKKGFLALADNRVLSGEFMGVDAGNRILFDAGNGAEWFSLDKLAYLPTETVVAKGRLTEIEKAVADGRAALERGEYVIALQTAGQAVKTMAGLENDGVSGLAPVEKKLNAFRTDIIREMSADNKTIHQDEVLPADDTARHLAAGHVRIKHAKVWVTPERICHQCRSRGWRICPECGGEGFSVTDCPDCENGFIPCEICGGSGWRMCPECLGVGTITVEREGRRGSSFFVGRCGYYGMYSKNTLVTTGKTTTVVMQPMFMPVVTGFGIIDTGFMGTVDEVMTCPRCDGVGQIPCPKGAKCAECAGKGVIRRKCPECDAAKRLPCEKCGGKGYFGAAVEFGHED